VFQ
ncbi:hypothetical protein CDAR_178331, partial [Caerostris darwini]|jgi:predicted porin